MEHLLRHQQQPTMSVSKLFLSILVLIATQGCNAESDPALVSALQGVGEVLECVSEATQESLLLHRQNSDVLADLHSLRTLPDLVLQLREQIAQQNANIETMKEDIAELRKGGSRNQDVKGLETQLETKVELVEKLTQEIQILRTQLESKNQKVQDLETKLHESQQLLGELENTMQLNKPMGFLDTNTDCHQPQIMDIRKTVQDFILSKNWTELWSGLESVLDPDSLEYRQLQEVLDPSMYAIGQAGLTQLASLLLCAGLPANTADPDGDTLLHGAAFGGHLDLVWALLGRGANVDDKGAHGSTALMRAANRGNLPLVQLLVQLGASTTATNSVGRTALSYASTPDVVRYLRQQMY